MSQIKPYKHCKKCGALIVNGNLCEDCKPKTNADRIRKMTDEELAIELEAFICNKVKKCRREDISCIDCALKWLKQEVSTNERN